MNKSNVLEEKIKDLSTEYIYNEAIGSLLLLLLSCVEDKQEKKFPYSLHSDILEIKNSIQNYILKIEEILNGEKQNKLSALDDCMNLKKKIISIYENIYYYFTNWNIPFSLINDEIAIRRYKKENILNKKLNLSEFYMDCVGFMEIAENLPEQKKFMGQLFKCFSLKMAREKYFDLLKKSLLFAFQDESEQSIQLSLKTFMHTCAPEKFEGYGTYFPEIAQFIASKKGIEPNKMDDETLNKEYESFNIVFEGLTKIEDYFECMFNDVNSLIILFYLNYTFDELTERELVYSDLYHTVCELLDGTLEQKDSDFYLDTVKKNLENAVEKIIDKANEVNEKELKLLQQVESFDDFSEDTSKILASENFLRACYYGNLNQEIFNFSLDASLPKASDEFKQKEFEQFIQSVKEYFSSLPVQMRKTAMVLLLSSLPIDWTVTEALIYIQDVLENAPSFEHQALTLDKVSMVFTDNGFQYKTETDFDEKNTCDCGHHHHHDHCDCGHDHHH